MKPHEVMSQEELQEFYKNHKDETINLYHYGYSESIKLHNLILLCRNVTTDDKGE